MDKRRTAYVLPYATKYEVNSTGQVVNTETGNELTIRDDNRIKLTNDGDEVIYIYPLRTFNQLHYAYEGFGTTYPMAPEFPDYFMKIENFMPVFYNIAYPTQPITIGKDRRIQLINFAGVRKGLNIFKAVAIYKLYQEDVGSAYVEDTFGDFGYRSKLEPAGPELSNKNLQILHPSLRYKNVNLLKHHPGYCIVDNPISDLVEVYNCRTGEPVETTYLATRVKRFRLSVFKPLYNGTPTGRLLYVGLTIDDLGLDPKDPEVMDYMDTWLHWEF